MMRSNLSLNLVIKNKKIFIKILVNQEVPWTIISHHKNVIFINKLNSSFFHKTNLKKTIKKTSKEMKITKNHTRAKTTFTTSNLRTKSIKMSVDFHKTKPSLTIQKNINRIKIKWESSKNFRTPSKGTMFLKNITQQDKTPSMTIMKWTKVMKIVNTNQYPNTSHLSLAICNRKIINLGLIIISLYMKISNNLISIMLREIVKIIQINIPIIRLRKISIQNRKFLMAKIFMKMNIKVVLPRISKSRNAVSLIIKIKNSKINHNVSYKNLYLNFIYLK